MVASLCPTKIVIALGALMKQLQIHGNSKRALKISPVLLRKSKGKLALWENANEALPARIVSGFVDIVEKNDFDLESFNASAISIIISVLLQAKATRERERGFYSVALALRTYCQSLPSCEDKIKIRHISHECLHKLIEHFLDSTEPSSQRQWIAILALTLMKNIGDDLKLVDELQDSAERLGSMIVDTNHEILRLLCGQTIQALIAMGAKKSWFWAERGNMSSEFPIDRKDPRNWLIAFQEYVNETLTENPNKFLEYLWYPLGLLLSPDTACLDRLIYFCISARNITVLLEPTENCFYDCLEVPFESIIEAKRSEVDVEISQTGKCNVELLLNSSPVCIWNARQRPLQAAQILWLENDDAARLLDTISNVKQISSLTGMPGNRVFSSQLQLKADGVKESNAIIDSTSDESRGYGDDEDIYNVSPVKSTVKKGALHAPISSFTPTSLDQPSQNLFVVDAIDHSSYIPIETQKDATSDLATMLERSMIKPKTKSVASAKPRLRITIPDSNTISETASTQLHGLGKLVEKAKQSTREIGNNFVKRTTKLDGGSKTLKNTANTHSSAPKNISKSAPAEKSKARTKKFYTLKAKKPLAAFNAGLTQLQETSSDGPHAARPIENSPTKTQQNGLPREPTPEQSRVAMKAQDKSFNQPSPNHKLNTNQPHSKKTSKAVLKVNEDSALGQDWNDRKLPTVKQAKTSQTTVTFSKPKLTRKQVKQQKLQAPLQPLTNDRKRRIEVSRTKIEPRCKRLKSNADLDGVYHSIESLDSTRSPVQLDNPSHRESLTSVTGILETIPDSYEFMQDAAEHNNFTELSAKGVDVETMSISESEAETVILKAANLDIPEIDLRDDDPSLVAIANEEIENIPPVQHDMFGDLYQQHVLPFTAENFEEDFPHSDQLEPRELGNPTEDITAPLDPKDKQITVSEQAERQLRSAARFMDMLENIEAPEVFAEDDALLDNPLLEKIGPSDPDQVHDLTGEANVSVHQLKAKLQPSPRISGDKDEEKPDNQRAQKRKTATSLGGTVKDKVLTDQATKYLISKESSRWPGKNMQDFVIEGKRVQASTAFPKVDLQGGAQVKKAIEEAYEELTDRQDRQSRRGLHPPQSDMQATSDRPHDGGHCNSHTKPADNSLLNEHAARKPHLISFSKNGPLNQGVVSHKPDQQAFTGIFGEMSTPKALHDSGISPEVPSRSSQTPRIRVNRLGSPIRIDEQEKPTFETLHSQMRDIPEPISHCKKALPKSPGEDAPISERYVPYKEIRTGQLQDIYKEKVLESKGDRSPFWGIGHHGKAVLHEQCSVHDTDKQQENNRTKDNQFGFTTCHNMESDESTDADSLNSAKKPESISSMSSGSTPSKGLEEDWMNAILPYQRKTLESLYRISNTLVRHLVGKEVAIKDIVDDYERNGMQLVDDLIATQDKERAAVIHDVSAYKKETAFLLRNAQQEIQNLNDRNSQPSYTYYEKEWEPKNRKIQSFIEELRTRME